VLGAAVAYEVMWVAGSEPWLVGAPLLGTTGDWVSFLTLLMAVVGLHFFMSRWVFST